MIKTETQQILLQKLAYLYHDEEDSILLKSITGVGDAEQLLNMINDFCVRYLNCKVLSCHFTHMSVGASFGLRLDNGQDAFLKIVRLPHNAFMETHSSLVSLCAASKVQEILHNLGYPCPAIIRHPTPYSDVVIMAHEFTDKGKQEDAHDPSIRRASAESFAELIRKAYPYNGSHGFIEMDNYQTESLYPKPHNALFDFAIGENEAGWIDEIAARSKQIINKFDKNVVIGHCYWSVKNMRFANERVVMIYDWDSLMLHDEFDLLGNAARAFTTTWDIPVKIVPSREEVNAFVTEYEYVRGKRFTKQEWVRISACATYHMCYTARCELSIDYPYAGSFRQALAEMKEDNYLGVK